MLESQLKALTQRVRKTLESGSSVAVVGWRDINHNSFTKKLPEKRIVFLDATPPNLGDKVGLVLFTKYMDHDVYKRFKKKKPVYKVVIEVRDIRTILESCADLLVPLPHSPAVHDGAKAEMTGLTADEASGNELSDAALNLITTPREKYEMNKMDCLTRAFLDAASTDKEGRVSMRTLAKLRETCDIEKTPQQLVSSGWIEKAPVDGKTKTGWYKAGPAMLENDGPKKAEEPDDPYEWAKWRVAQEDAVLARKAEIEAELANVVAEIAEIELAKEALARLNDLKPKRE
ncbi:MAG: hypothetical protein PHD04_01955 [Candidatus Pacebacteria bacterium]|nr:hypothetical protein [Candidatus Paceibacterota bacterium]